MCRQGHVCPRHRPRIGTAKRIDSQGRRVARGDRVADHEAAGGIGPSRHCVGRSPKSAYETGIVDSARLSAPHRMTASPGHGQSSTP
jgi:hypothetical protein